MDSLKFITIPESNAELIVGGVVTIKSTSQNIKPGLNQSLNQGIVTDESLGLPFSGFQFVLDLASVPDDIYVAAENY